MAGKHTKTCKNSPLKNSLPPMHQIDKVCIQDSHVLLQYVFTKPSLEWLVSLCSAPPLRPPVIINTLISFKLSRNGAASVQLLSLAKCIRGLQSQFYTFTALAEILGVCLMCIENIVGHPIACWTHMLLLQQHFQRKDICIRLTGQKPAQFCCLSC